MKRVFLIFSLFFSVQVFAKVETTLLSQKTYLSFDRVPEFAFIQKQANKLGVKVYLFGGTASAFAHYVRWDLEREAGDDKYQEERFDYDFTNIYRGNQDLDIVVDGTAEQAAQLEQILKEKYPHFVGSKEAWEVRLLQAQVKDKLPLLDNYGFLNQHTDTNSTGMLAVNPDKDGIVFRDLFSWDDSESQFLKDVANGEIKFLFSDTHEKTSRAKEGKNPPIFAATRYLAKLAQYEVKGTSGDLKVIKKIVDETDWESVASNSYVKHKLEEFGKKVLLNAPDSEYAWNLLESTGLRERLIEMDGYRTRVRETLSWWMNKEPLRSKKIGQGEGLTASEIFKDDLIVSHETLSFLAYENITRSSKGRANAFISRRNVTGETAAFGPGFYTKLGAVGARGTGLTIRFKIHPDAREGEDFLFEKQNGFVVILNKSALTLIPENLNISTLGYLKMLAGGEIGEEDKGFLEKLRRKFSRKKLEEAEVIQIAAFIETLSISKHTAAISYWFSTQYSIRNAKLLEGVVEAHEELSYSDVMQHIMPYDPWVKRRGLIEKMLESMYGQEEFARYVLSNPYSLNYIDIVEELISSKYYTKELSFGLSHPHWGKHPHLILKLIEKGVDRLSDIIENTLSNPVWANNKDVTALMIKKLEFDHELEEFFEYVVPYMKRENQISFLNEMVKKKGEIVSESLRHFLAEELWRDDMTLFSKLMRKVGDYSIVMNAIDEHGGDITKEPEAMRELIKFGKRERRNRLNIWSPSEIVNTFTKHSSLWVDYPDIIKELIRFESDYDRIVEGFFTNPLWIKHSDLLEKIVKKKESNDKIIYDVISSTDEWLKHKSIINMLIDDLPLKMAQEFEWRPEAPHVSEYLLRLIKKLKAENDRGSWSLGGLALDVSSPGWEQYPEVLMALIDSDSNVNTKEKLKEVLNQRFFGEKRWAKHPVLVEFLNGKSPVTYGLLSVAGKKRSFNSWYQNKHLKQAFSCKALLLN